MAGSSRLVEGSSQEATVFWSQAITPTTTTPPPAGDVDAGCYHVSRLPPPGQVLSQGQLGLNKVY